MSKMAMTEVSMERCLLDMPYEILFEIFRGLSKGKLIEISRLCSNIRDIAGDTRFWEKVYVKYKCQCYSTYKFEELYSEPWPVNVVDLSDTTIFPSPSSRIDQVVKVTKLNLSSIITDKVTIEAILAKYQCRELKLNFDIRVGCKGCIAEITPATFLKQTALEVLSLSGVEYYIGCFKPSLGPSGKVVLWLPQVLENCKHLKTLDLSYTSLPNDQMLLLVKNLPTSVEKLFLAETYIEDSFFQMLAESTPNLRELELTLVDVEECPSLLKFKFLETLHVILYGYQDCSVLRTCLTKFPALKTVYIGVYRYALDFPETYLEEVRKTLELSLEPHGITVGRTRKLEWPYPVDGSLWEVKKIDGVIPCQDIDLLHACHGNGF